MLVNPGVALEGIAEVIEKEIIPDLNSNYPKAQSHAIVSMLRNLSIWENERNKALLEENAGLEQLLRKARMLLNSNKIKGKNALRLIKKIEQMLSTGKRLALEEYNSKLRGLLDDTLLFLGSNPRFESIGSFRKLRNEIRSFLRQNIQLEVNLSSPSKMAEFSKGSESS